MKKSKPQKCDSYGAALKQALQITQSFSKPLRFLLAALVFCAVSASAAQLTWDAGNTNNGAAIDAGSGAWDISYLATNFTAATITTATTNVNLVAGGIDWFQVSVPVNAQAATNRLLYATNLPVNIWFSLSQTTNNVGDTLLMAGVTSGVSVLTTNLASAPTNIVQGGTYYIGIDNAANGVAVGYALEVDLSVSNAVTTTRTNLNWNTGSGNTSWTQTSTTAGLNGAIFSGPDAAAGTYVVSLDSGTQMAVTNLQINANGYVFTDNGNTANTLFINTALNPPNPTMLVASGKSVTFSNRWFFPNNNSAKAWQLGTSGAASSASFFGAIGGEQITFTSTNGSVFWLAGASAPSVVTINADVRQTNGTFTTTGFSIGRPGGGVNLQGTAGATNAPAAFTLDGPSTVMTLATAIQMGRNTKGQGIVNVQNGATVNMASGANHIQISTDSQANMIMAFNMYGGTVNLGTGSSSVNSIWFYKNGVNSGGGGTATFNQTGGVVNAWGGIQFGIASGTVINSGIAAVTNSGGFLYIGPGGSIGISKFANTAATNYITLSGGTVGALGNWISSMPMTLATLNGNITFQTADANTTPWNIGLSGALTGPGGFNKTGSGTLTLSGANNYAGTTVVSNGLLVVSTVNLPKSGDVILDGSAASSSGLPVVSNVVNNVGQNWTMTNLTFAAGLPTMSFNFGSLPPSTTVAPIQANGNVAFTVTPNIDVIGTAIPSGVYPLIKYTGTISGLPPSGIVSLANASGASSASLVNNTGNKSIDLHITTSVNPALKWLVGNGTWDTTTANWTQGGGPTLYTDDGTKDVVFDDTASGTSPILITLNTTLNQPKSVTANNATKAYVISGTGDINGPCVLTVKGGGSLTLSNANTYAGGTVVQAGQLNINYGGDASGTNSAIGIGPLTLDLAAKIDNTSGHSITLVATIAQNWLDDWTYLGSTNFDTGLGAITLGSSIVTLNVVSNTLAVSGPIGDGGNIYKIQKAGNGTLTLRVDSSFAGGLELVSGQVNLGSANCLGNGTATIDGGTIDNVSGADLTLSGVASYEFQVALNGTFTYLGTSNNLDLGGAQIHIGTGANEFWNIASNTLTLEGNLAVGNATITKIGNGTLAVIGVGTAAQASFVVNQGELDAGRVVGVTFGNGGNGRAFQVQSNAVVKLLSGGNGNQIINGAYNVPILDAGGVFDMNGQTETVDGLAMTNGVLRSSLAGTIATLTITPTAGVHDTNAVILGDINNIFDVPTSDAELDIAGEVTGSGSLVKTGLGIVNLFGTNSYTGNTTISNGTLVLNYPFLSTNSTVTVNTNATLGTNGVLTLNFVNSDTNTVAVLVLGGASKPAGVYNATTDPAYISGTGSLLVVPPPPINPLPGTIQFSVSGGSGGSGGTLALSWPTNLGWILQNQTNALNIGLTVNSNAWLDISGSALVTSTNITINPVNPTVFFRLRHP